MEAKVKVLRAPRGWNRSIPHEAKECQRKMGVERYHTERAGSKAQGLHLQPLTQSG